MSLAARVMGPSRADWIKAMQAELAHLPDDISRKAFARGCFIASLKSTALTKRGLHYLGRGGSAAWLLLLGLYCLWLAGRTGGTAQTDNAAVLMAGTGGLYVVFAPFMALSRKYFRGMAGLAAVAGGVAWTIMTIGAASFASPEINLPFTRAIFLEMSALMLTLTAFQLILYRLYDPKCEPA